MVAVTAEQQRDKRIVEGKGTFMDKLPYILSIISCVVCIIAMVFMLATGRTNKAKSIASGALNVFSTMK